MPHLLKNRLISRIIEAKGGGGSTVGQGLFEDIPQREKTYDHIFKEILEAFPSHLVIAFLNSVFKHEMSPDSHVESVRTESNRGNPTIADYILKVTEPNGRVRSFHMEAQTIARRCQRGYHFD